MSRPRKLTGDFLIALNTVLKENFSGLVCTDEELLVLVNEQLPPSSQVSARSFRRYKAKALQADEQHLDKLFVAFKKALELCRIKEKQNIFRCIVEDGKTWTKWKWMLERKYTDWDSNNKENKDMQPVVLNITPHSNKPDS